MDASDIFLALSARLCSRDGQRSLQGRNLYGTISSGPTTWCALRATAGFGHLRKALLPCQADSDIQSNATSASGQVQRRAKSSSERRKTSATRAPIRERASGCRVEHRNEPGVTIRGAEEIVGASRSPSFVAGSLFFVTLYAFGR